MPFPNQPSSRIENRLLAALPRREYKRFTSHLEHAFLDFAEVLYEPGNTIQHVYFPNEAVVSLLSSVEDGATLEVGIIGNEGMVGISVFLGVKTSPNRAVVQRGGSALRLKASALRKEVNASRSLQALLSRYTHCLMTQISQAAACSRFHMVEARLARWLLMTRDRKGSDEFQLTQEFLSSMLGVRREGVTNGAGALQRNKLIAYSRGHIRILDWAGLEAVACNCYRILKAEYDSFPTV